MGKGERSPHLSTDPVLVEFERIVTSGWGSYEVRRMVPDPTPGRPRRNDPATPVAWAGAAGSRVADGREPGAVVASMGELGVFCTALGAVSLLASMPALMRAQAWVRHHDLPDHLALATPHDLPEVRACLEDADEHTLRVWTTHLLAMVVEAFARQAPRWLPWRRTRFAGLVLERFALPA
ncbi:MAG: hypothetical protein RI900_601 [Actinomycetota bacterium]|jgi:hypothetical protein